MYAPPHLRKAYGYDRIIGLRVKRIGQTRLEWTLLGIIAAVCGVLSFLQYQWTGELSRAEPALLRAGLNEQLRRLVQAFNNEIHENCSMLLPDAKELREHGTAEAHKIRYEQWASSHDSSVFRQIGIAVPEQGTLPLYGFNRDGRIALWEWPPDWRTLRAGMTERMNGTGRPPDAPPDSALIEIPVFAELATADETLPEIEWMIFELNLDYVRTKLLPRLTSEYLNPAGNAVYDVSVSWARPNGHVVFSTRKDGASVTPESDATAGLLASDIVDPPGRGSGRGRNERRPSRWTISARHREGSLDAAVSRIRTRNLVASLLLVGLLGSTAWALVQ